MLAHDVPRSVALRIWLLLACLALSMLGYMTLGARGSWAFLLPFRGAKLAALLLVAVSISTATVLFQTITRNRILTPSIMGFDALYMLIVTLMVFALGGQGFAQLSHQTIFALSVFALMLASLLLFGSLLMSGGRDLMRMILTGIIFGTLFRSLTSLMVRMIDPNEFAMVQVASFARFSRIDTSLLLIASLMMGGALLGAWRMRYRLDVLALGHDGAINLGEEPRRGHFQVLCLVAVLVSVSTALVGPVAFLGLLVVAITLQLIPTERHAVLLPAAALVSSIVLVGGQTLLERLLGLATPLSVVIDVLGGCVFLWLLLRGVRR